ncbi:MAG: cytochrome c1, partial [Rhodobacteraceae bacterium]|nr:cytochrome c1 [Paracoccaceae bacterium]MCB2140715.1 cytochrome c1 [Paracoccaceae bacterium]MCB2159844.1 cytochrome c1 [Paracoccaceae bacterium]
MLKKIAITAASVLALSTGAHAAGAEQHIEDFAFSFEGPFGTYDEHQLQRGLQVFTEVCSACHGMKQVRIGELSEEGGPSLPEDQVRAYAANLSVVDKETGEDRPATPADKFPANTGAGAPDLSVIAKARAA